MSHGYREYIFTQLIQLEVLKEKKMRDVDEKKKKGTIDQRVRLVFHKSIIQISQSAI